MKWFLRQVRKTRSRLRKKSFEDLPEEQKDLLNFSKFIIRQPCTETHYCPYTGVIVISSLDYKSVIKGTSVIIISKYKSVSFEIERKVVEEIISYISKICLHKANMIGTEYNKTIRNLNLEFNGE